MNTLRITAATLALSLLAVAWNVGSVGCGGGPVPLYNCVGPVAGEQGKDGGLDPCHCQVATGVSCPCTDPNQFNNSGLTGVQIYQICMEILAGELDGGDTGEGGPLPACAGQCVPLPLGWSGPALLAIGSAPVAGCPSNAPDLTYSGYANPAPAPLPCPTCSCSPPAGTCGLPPTITASSSASCNDDGGAVPFDTPAGWDGGCTTDDVLDAGVASFTIAPLIVNEIACTPISTPSVGTNDPGWTTFAQACTISGGGACPTADQTCLAADAGAWKQCVSALGEQPCPNGSQYSEPHIFYASADDTRSCSACACGSPVGSACSSYVSLWSDAMCSVPVGSALVGSNAPGCVEGLSPSAVRSTSAGRATYTPGVCQPNGGVASGAVTPIGPSTFCCIP